MRVLVASTRALEGAALQGGDESVEVACEAVAERLEGLPTGLPGPAEPVFEHLQGVDQGQLQEQA